MYHPFITDILWWRNYYFWPMSQWIIFIVNVFEEWRNILCKFCGNLFLFYNLVLLDLFSPDLRTDTCFRLRPLTFDTSWAHFWSSQQYFWRELLKFSGTICGKKKDNCGFIKKLGIKFSLWEIFWIKLLRNSVSVVESLSFICMDK